MITHRVAPAGVRKHDEQGLIRVSWDLRSLSKNASSLHTGRSRAYPERNDLRLLNVLEGQT